MAFLGIDLIRHDLVLNTCVVGELNLAFEMLSQTYTV